MKQFRADLHIHSRYSRATSKKLTLPLLAAWAQIKGLSVLGSGDFTHPQWRTEMKEALEPDEQSGLLRLKNPIPQDILTREAPWLAKSAPEQILFIPQAEISSIYKKDGRTRRIHNLIYVPDFEAAEHLCARLSQVGNLAADGRPILGLDAHDLLEIVLESHPQAYLIPAHIWTPWFSLFGSKSGFDSVEQCFGDLSPHIFAMETGLSSDPAMNRLWSALDRFRLVSNSDAHSGDKLAREANIFSGQPSYHGILKALKEPDHEHKLIETIEFFPEEGKYHLDGHRSCGIATEPEDTKAYNGHCPVCGKELTIGVLNRVLTLADRTSPVTDSAFSSLVPLTEIIAEILGCGRDTQKVLDLYGRCLAAFGSELEVLKSTPQNTLASFFPPLGEAIARMRAGKVLRQPGFDGQFGIISLFTEQERLEMRGGRLLQNFAPMAGNAHKTKSGPKKTASAQKAPEQAETSLLAPCHAEKMGYSQTQTKATKAGLRPMLVLAGPGTGKTHTLIGRILNLIAAGESPRHILAVTFTRRAADELETRLHAMLGGKEALPRADTLHALAFEHWRRIHGEPPTVLSEEAAWRVFTEANQEYSKADLAKAWKELVMVRERRLNPDHALAIMYQRYTKNKESWNLADYSDLLEFWLDKIENRLYANPYTHVLVDEIQDMTTLQLAIVTGLTADGGRGFFAIGDPRQSIYGFRGVCAQADRFIAGLWPELESITLEENYRSGQDILHTAAALFPGSKPLKAVNQVSRPVNLFEAQDSDQEAAWIARHINNLIGGSGHSLMDRKMTRDSHAELSPGDIAILVRFKALIPPLLKTMNNYGLLCAAPESEAFWQDSRVSLILNAVGRTLGISMDAEIEIPGCPDALFTKDPADIALRLQSHKPFDHFFWQSAAFKELKLAHKKYGGWLELINWINLQSDLEQIRKRGEKTQIMTLHASKGLEFNTVFLPALEDGILPFKTTEGFMAGGRPATDPEEERRIFYVGLTRAKERLFLSWSKRRGLYGRDMLQEPSPFLADLPKEHLKVSTMVARTEYKEQRLSLL